MNGQKLYDNYYNAHLKQIQLEEVEAALPQLQERAYQLSGQRLGKHLEKRREYYQVLCFVHGKLFTACHSPKLQFPCLAVLVIRKRKKQGWPRSNWSDILFSLLEKTHSRKLKAHLPQLLLNLPSLQPCLMLTLPPLLRC